MLDSHRLTPLSGLQMALGYLVGAPCQALLLFAGGTLLGQVLMVMLAGRVALAPGVSSLTWAAGQAALLVLAVFMWSVILASALVTRGRSPLLGVVAIVGILGGWFLVLLVPGLALVAGVLPIALLTSGGGSRVMEAFATGMAFQDLIAAVFVLAAARKVRRPELPLFSIPLGLALVVAVALLQLAGVPLAQASVTRIGDNTLTSRMASLAIVMLAAQFALIAAAAATWRADQQCDLAAERRHWGGLPLVVPLLLAAIGALTYAALTEVPSDEILALAGLLLVALLAAFWIDFHLLYAVIARGGKVVWVVLIAMVVLRLLPLLADVAYVERSYSTFDMTRGMFAGLSPLGTVLWLDADNAMLLPGIGVQMLLAIVATGLRRVRAPAATKVAPA